jgi:hypothetical protein
MPVFAQSKSDTALSDAQSPKPIVVAGEKQVFIDGRFIAHSRNVALHMNQPVKQGVVLRPECPWEDKSIGFCASVMEHEGVFKLFYRADSHEKGASVPDGVHWTAGPRVLDICPDTANQAAWDRQRAKYVAYIRSVPRRCECSPLATFDVAAYTAT